MGGMRSACTPAARGRPAAARKRPTWHGDNRQSGMRQVTPASLEAAAGITQGSGGRTQLVTGPMATLAPPQSIAGAAPWLLADTDEPPLRPASRRHRSLRATPLAAAAALLGCEGEGGCLGAQEQVHRRLSHASESTAAPAESI